MENEIASRWLFKELMDFDVSIPRGSDYDVYMKALLICANGDNRLSEEERNWVVGYCAALGGSPELVEELKSFSPEGSYQDIINSHPKAVQSVRAFIYDAIRACSADGEYNDQERGIVHQAAATLGVPEEVVIDLEKIYVEDRKIRQKRLALIWADGKSY
jgi:tellurite resistance protein